MIQYHMDLESFPLKSLKSLCETGNLLPSEQILGEAVEERFAVLESMGIKTLADVSAALKTKKKLVQFAETSGLSQDYLTILRRRVGIYTPRPVSLNKMVGIDPVHIERLAEKGIKNSLHLFERGQSRENRAALAELTGVPEKTILELIKLSDIVRAPYVGAVYARLFYATEIDTLAKIADSDPAVLCARLRQVNEEQNLMRAGLPSAEDMGSFLEIVQMIPKMCIEP